MTWSHHLFQTSNKKRKQAKKLVEKARVIQQSKKAAAEEKGNLRRSSRTEASAKKSYCEDEVRLKFILLRSTQFCNSQFIIGQNFCLINPHLFTELTTVYCTERYGLGGVCSFLNPFVVKCVSYLNSLVCGLFW